MFYVSSPHLYLGADFRLLVRERERERERVRERKRERERERESERESERKRIQPSEATQHLMFCVPTTHFMSQAIKKASCQAYTITLPRQFLHSHTVLHPGNFRADVA